MRMSPRNVDGAPSDAWYLSSMSGFDSEQRLKVAPPNVCNGSIASVLQRPCYVRLAALFGLKSDVTSGLRRANSGSAVLAQKCVRLVNRTTDDGEWLIFGERIEPRARLRPATAPSVSPIWWARAVPAPWAPTPKSAPRAMADANGSRARIMSPMTSISRSGVKLVAIQQRALRRRSRRNTETRSPAPASGGC